MPMIELAKFFRDPHRQSMRLADKLRSLARAPKIAGINRMEFLVAE